MTVSGGSAVWRSSRGSGQQNTAATRAQQHRGGARKAAVCKGLRPAHVVGSISGMTHHRQRERDSRASVLSSLATARSTTAIRPSYHRAPKRHQHEGQAHREIEGRKGSHLGLTLRDGNGGTQASHGDQKGCWRIDVAATTAHGKSVGQQRRKVAGLPRLLPQNQKLSLDRINRALYVGSSPRDRWDSNPLRF